MGFGVDAGGEGIPVGKAELQRHEFEAIGVAEFELLVGEALAERTGHLLGIKESLHGLNLSPGSEEVSARVADGLPEVKPRMMIARFTVPEGGASGRLHGPRPEDSRGGESVKGWIVTGVPGRIAA